MSIPTSSVSPGDTALEPFSRPARNWASERDVLNDLAATGLSPAERLTLHAIDVHIASHAEGWPSQATIARLSGLTVRQIRRVVSALLARGFLLARYVTPGGALPDGSRTETGRNVYRRGPRWLERPPHHALLRDASDSRAARPGLPKPTGHCVRGPADRMTSKEKPTLKKIPPPLPPEPSWQKQPPPSPAVREEADLQIGSSERDPGIAAVGQSWEKLGMGELDQRARRALENRRSEGATLEQLEAAVAGAGADDWVRTRAKVPFAVVFASLASVERFAHEGRKVLSLRAERAKRAADERKRDEEWRVHCRAVLRAEKPPAAEALLREMPASAARKALRTPPEPLTLEELAKRKADQLAAIQALMSAAEPK